MRDTFWYGVIRVGIFLVTRFVSEVQSTRGSKRRSLYKSISSCLISWWVIRVFPYSSSNFIMQFMKCLWIMEWWKNLEFFSPSLSHLIQDLFLQRISSCLYISSSFLLMTLSYYCFVTMWHVCIIFFWRSSKFCYSVFLLERCSQRPLCSICEYVVWSVLYFDGREHFGTLLNICIGPPISC